MTHEEMVVCQENGQLLNIHETQLQTLAVVVDIETVAEDIPDWYREEVEADVRARYVKEDIIDKHRSKGLKDWGFEPDGARVVAFGFSPILENVNSAMPDGHGDLYRGVARTICSNDSRRVLYEASRVYELMCGVPWITYNGSHFDLPVIASSSLRLGVALRLPLRRPSHVDLFRGDLFRDSKPSLKRACQMYGVNPPTTSGASVGGWFESGQYDKIAAHCAEDVTATAELYLKLCKIFGKKAIDGAY